MKNFSLLVKPAGPDCNLVCSYCFYLPKAGLYPATREHRMSRATLERVISSYMATDQPQYTFGWQGGEPTLMGEEFFRAVTDLEEKHGRAGSSVANGLQTNGVLLSPSMAAHFVRYGFLVGLSIDGPPDVHDQSRKTRAGGGSYLDAMKGARILAEAGVSFNILAVVSSANVRQPGRVWAFMAGNGFAWQQYIPCVEWGPDGRLAPWSISGEEWGDFLCGIFDEWIRNPSAVSVRQFDAVLNLLVEGRRVLCTMETDCRQYFMVEHNGDVYPCDFHAEPGLLLGNVGTDSWESMAISGKYASFGKRKMETAGKCVQCEWLEFCRGDCQKHRPQWGGGRSLSHLCEGWRRFYSHSMPRFRELAKGIKASR